MYCFNKYRMRICEHILNPFKWNKILPIVLRRNIVLVIVGFMLLRFSIALLTLSSSTPPPSSHSILSCFPLILVSCHLLLYFRPTDNTKWLNRRIRVIFSFFLSLSPLYSIRHPTSFYSFYPFVVPAYFRITI